ncbi:hypothetical protein ACH5RR_023563 [Cinchona calisaya]|uniref:Uncharacterized protein n=1 Tax=Cinchona calisaya TaxID=153742 RepID=A0ABD2ZB10_9GENT
MSGESNTMTTYPRGEMKILHATPTLNNRKESCMDSFPARLHLKEDNLTGNRSVHELAPLLFAMLLLLLHPYSTRDKETKAVGVSAGKKTTESRRDIKGDSLVVLYAQGDAWFRCGTQVLLHLGAKLRNSSALVWSYFQAELPSCEDIVIPRPWLSGTDCNSIGKRRTPCEDKRPRTQVIIPSTAVGAGQPWSWYNNTLSSGSHKGRHKKGAFFVTSPLWDPLLKVLLYQDHGCPAPIGERRTPCEDKRLRTQVRIPSTAVGVGQPWSWYSNTLSRADLPCCSQAEYSSLLSVIAAATCCVSRQLLGQAELRSTVGDGLRTATKPYTYV